MTVASLGFMEGLYNFYVHYGFIEFYDCEPGTVVFSFAIYGRKERWWEGVKGLILNYNWDSHNFPYFL